MSLVMICAIQVRSARANLPLGPEKYNEKPHRGHQEGQNHREGGDMENWQKFRQKNMNNISPFSFATAMKMLPCGCFRHR